jgi:LacI family transcriptional regulator
VGWPKGHWAVCLRITPGPWQRASVASTGRGFFEAAQTPGIRIDFEAIPTDLNLPQAEIRQLVRRARKNGIQGLFFLPSRISAEMMEQDERLLAECKAAGIPVVLFERNLRGDDRPLEYDLVCPDGADGGFRCAMHLLEIGRRNLAFVRGGPTSSHNAMIAGFLSAQSLARQTGLLPVDAPFPLVMDFPEGSASPDAYRFLCDRLLEKAIDGVVCYHDRCVVGLTMELLARGKRVPQDVALTGFDDQPIGQEFSICVTTYAFPGIEIAAHALQIMRGCIEEPAPPPPPGHLNHPVLNSGNK